MILILKIDRALYEVDDAKKVYWYRGRNPDWKRLSREENRANKKHINGHTRIFPDGKRKVFTFKEQ